MAVVSQTYGACSPSRTSGCYHAMTDLPPSQSVTPPDWSDCTTVSQLRTLSNKTGIMYRFCGNEKTLLFTILNVLVRRLCLE